MMKTNFHNKPRKPLSRGTKQMKRSGFKQLSLHEFAVKAFAKAVIKLEAQKKSPIFNMLKRTSLAKVSKDPVKKRYAVLWKVFSTYIKERDNWTCIISGKRVKGSQMHAGHFIEDAVGGLTLRYNEDNVHAQHEDSNMNSTSETRALYEEALTRKIGAARVSELYRLHHQAITKDFDVEERIEYFREKLESLKDK